MNLIQLHQTDKTTGKTEQYVALSFAEEITKGILFLDDEDPQWMDKVDLSILDLSETDVCVCGQVFEGFFEEGVKRLAKRYPRDWRRAHDPHAEDGTITYRWGFDIPSWVAVEHGQYTAKTKADARISWDWAASYLSDGQYDAFAAYRDQDAQTTLQSNMRIHEMQELLYSALTEQWIQTIKQLRGERGVQ